MTRLTVLLSDGSQVQATVAEGLLLAWWPGDADATSAQATGNTGTTAQQLTFNTVSPTNTPGLHSVP